MTRAMTPAAIRRLGEFAVIDADAGEPIPLDQGDVDYRVKQVSCLALTAPHVFNLAVSPGRHRSRPYKLRAFL